MSLGHRHLNQSLSSHHCSIFLSSQPNHFTPRFHIRWHLLIRSRETLKNNKRSWSSKPRRWKRTKPIWTPLSPWWVLWKARLKKIRLHKIRWRIRRYHSSHLMKLRSLKQVWLQQLCSKLPLNRYQRKQKQIKLLFQLHRPLLKSHPSSSQLYSKKKSRKSFKTLFHNPTSPQWPLNNNHNLLQSLNHSHQRNKKERFLSQSSSKLRWIPQSPKRKSKNKKKPRRKLRRSIKFKRSKKKMTTRLLTSLHHQLRPMKNSGIRFRKILNRIRRNPTKKLKSKKKWANSRPVNSTACFHQEQQLYLRLKRRRSPKQ